MSNVVGIRKKPNQEGIDLLKDIIAKMERCEVTGFSIVSEGSDGTYELNGSTTLSRLQTAGALLDLAVHRLK